MSEKRHPSSRLFYGVAVALGLSFSAVLVVLAWNNVVQSETRNFAVDAIAAQSGVERNILTADAVSDNLARFLATSPAAAVAAFPDYAGGMLARYGFVVGLGHGRLLADGRVELAGVVGELSAEMVSRITRSEDGRRIVMDGLERGAVPLVAETPGDGLGRLFLLHRIDAAAAPGGSVDIGVLALDLPLLVNEAAIDPKLDIALYTESEGVAGRRLVYVRAAPRRGGGGLVDELETDGTVRLDSFSLRLVSSTDVYWRELDKGLVFVASFLGLGVTLLLVALARAKEIQARELEARNRVIEEQVRQQTRDLAEARDQALEASRVKSDFLASMSHEIRTPLNAIIGMADLLSETRLDDEQGKYVGVFRNAGEALLSLVNDILDLSKIEAEQLSLESIEFDVVDIVEQATEIYALKADDRGIELVTDIDPSVSPRVRGDPGRMRQIILNLVGNAIKFTEAGQVVVRVAPAGGAGREDLLHFEVEDSGIGIPADKLESIFSNFTQVDSSTTRKYGGTGLGLAICKRLVDMMDGAIWVESVEGQGSTFQFDVRLPAAEVGAAAAPPQLRRALVVEQNEHQAAALARILSDTGADVELRADIENVAADMRSAADAGRPFDLLVVDGGAAEDWVGKLRAGGDLTPVLCLFRPSRLTRGVESLRGVEATAYVGKPVRRGQLFDAVRAAVAGTRHGAEEVTADVGGAVGEARILLVEDNEDNRLLVRAYLKSEPYELVEAENGAEAVERFKEGDFDLVLMDVQMPVMDGYAATRSIRAWEQDHARQRTPVIALTANAVKEDIDTSRAAGCDDHLTKPIKKKTLVAALRDRLAATA
ncbi:MAG: ATP-binding protein [Gammaproteobacteria bacterium]